jgi:hypothetical protein
MTPDEELDLVRKAIVMGKTVTGCFEWDDRARPRVQADSALLRLSPDAIRNLAIEFVEEGGIIRQVREQRPEYGEFDFYYKIVLAGEGLPLGLFVEMRLTDADEDCPTVMLVNAHPQTK